MKTIKRFIKNGINNMWYLKNVYSQLETLKKSIDLNKHPDLFIKGGTSPYDNLSSVSTHDTSQVPPERWLQFDDIKMVKSIREYMENDKYPIPSPADREGYFGMRHYHYWLSGLKDYLLIKQTLNSNGCYIGDSSNILDLGCASGRVLRHFQCQETNVVLWGVDINLRHAEWIRLFLSPSIKVFPNTILPHLSIEDNTFTLVYAFSVFTHIADLELAWIAEIRRILKKGGIAYLTIHSDNTWKNIESARPLYDNLLAMKGHIHNYEVTSELFKKPMPSDKTVFEWTTASAYNSNVFHSIAYIKNEWGKFFEILDIINEGHNYQDVIVLRKT